MIVVMAGDGKVNSSKFTSVKITPDELEKITDTQGWCDVCKGWEEEA